MSLIAHTSLPTFARLRAEGQEVLSPDRAHQQDIRELHVGLLNMMPDAALQATERQFLRLVGSCNRIVQFYIHVFTLPGIARSGAAAEYVAAHYETMDAVLADGLDALIISGANPVHPDIRDEPYWGVLEAVMRWAEANVASTLCSCLASHAHIAQQYGVERVALATKQWGVYSHRVTGLDHPLMANLNTRFDAPHSRWNDVPRAALEAVGVRVLAESAEAGVHLAVSPDGIRWVYLQGHPEYDVQSLLKEYQREVQRFASGERQDYPPCPDNYFNPRARELLEWHRSREEAARAAGAPAPDFPEAALWPELENSWTDTGKALFNNWLGLIYQITHTERYLRYMPAIDPADPLGLGCARAP